MMKSRKEKTTRKRGLTSEEYIDILNESKPDKNEWKELLKIAMETRKFEIELYWKRANELFLALCRSLLRGILPDNPLRKQTDRSRKYSLYS